MTDIKKHLCSLLTLIAIFTSPLSLANFKTLANFGENPGELQASYFSPHKTTDSVVVFLHGCVQNGQLVAEQSGLLALANKYNFTLLVPQQSKNNNMKQCFNWFSPQDIDKNKGESLSIKNMILAIKKRQKATKIYVIGLSAGGAMTSSLLVNYPKLFVGAGIIAGIPTPCADNLIKAISCMRSGPSQSVDELIKLVNQQTKEQTNWPKLSIWTGKADTIVHPQNSVKMASQWAGLMKLSKQNTLQQEQGYQIQQWHNEHNQVQVELVQLDNLNHGMAVNPQLKNGGITAPFLLNAPVSAAVNIINFWQLNK